MTIIATNDPEKSRCKSKSKLRMTKTVSSRVHNLRTDCDTEHI